VVPYGVEFMRNEKSEAGIEPEVVHVLKNGQRS
jgi:hypothetical protein